MKNKTKTARKGFTLIELIVVMAVIGILVLLAAPKFLGYTQKAQETKHIHTAKVIETALEAYLIHGGIFPEDLEVVDETTLNEAANNESLYGVKGLIGSPDGETYYELTHDFIKKLDVKLSVINELFIEAMASSVPTALYASEKGITLVDKSKTLKGYELQVGELPNEINQVKVNQLTTGGGHSLALMYDGTVRAWGGNSNGQLGDGTTINKSTPVTIVGLTGVKQLVAGERHTLALMEDGTVKAWGMNNYGQLGDGTTTDNAMPVNVTGLTGVKELTSGSNHTLALMNDGTVKVWGFNNYGQLGIGSVAQRTTPVKVTGLIGVKSLFAGYHHSLAFMNDGSVKAWGYNGYGQLGNGTTTNEITPMLVTSLIGIVKQLDVGYSHTLALMEDGTVKAWGQNIYGQLGDGSTISKSAPVTIVGLTDVKELAAGSAHTLALMNDSTVKAWGRNDFGQLGEGSIVQINTPVTITNLFGVKQIGGGSSHTLVLMEDGTVKAWGYNSNGQLGDGTTDNRHTPTLITIE